MSPLQIGLIIFGAIVLLAVILYNRWQAQRKMPRRAHGDAREAAVEPSWLDDAALPGSATATPVLDAAMTPASNASVNDMPVPGQGQPLDALVDVIAPVALEGPPLAGAALLRALPATRRIGSKPFAVQARRSSQPIWEFPLAEQSYDALQVGVQLANRTGALSEIEFSEFVVVARLYADAVGGEPHFPDMMHEVARARELDQFARSHDVRLSLSVRARRVRWSVGYVVQQAGELGFCAGGISGKMIWPSALTQQPPVLELSFGVPAPHAPDVAQQPVVLLTLGFDVPHVLQRENPAQRLHELAFALACAMDGEVIADGGQPLQAAAWATVETNLAQLYDALEAHGLPAGAPETRRLFS